AHVIKLGPKNYEAAREALRVWPNSLQIGGGITFDNARKWIDTSADKKKIIITKANMLPVKRKHLIAEQKKEICEKKLKFLFILNNKIAVKYGVKKTYISDILKQSSKWLDIDTTNEAKANRKRNHQPKWPKLNEVMHIWVESALAADIDLIQATLFTKAKYFAIALNIINFKDTGWVNKFQNWLDLHQYTRN
ncbi:923_t:CDS:2, partial [Dentiscutata erythropus]